MRNVSKRPKPSDIDLYNEGLVLINNAIKAKVFAQQALEDYYIRMIQHSCLTIKAICTFKFHCNSPFLINTLKSQAY